MDPPLKKTILKRNIAKTVIDRINIQESGTLRIVITYDMVTQNCFCPVKCNASYLSGQICRLSGQLAIEI